LEKLVDIIAGCADNDPKCQKWFYQHYFGFGLKTAFRYVYAYEKAIDATNDAFVKIFRNLKNFENRDPENIEKIMMGWIKRIVVNASIDYMRRESLVPEYKPISEEIWDEAGHAQSADNSLMYKELISLVKNLSPAYRVVFNLHVIDGFSHQEIADQLGISLGTSKSNLSKAKAQLQKFMVKDYKGNVLCFT
jgi:RNA polymerase sigma factor (sigma-70 family)